MNTVETYTWKCENCGTMNQTETKIATCPQCGVPNQEYVNLTSEDIKKLNEILFKIDKSEYDKWLKDKEASNPCSSCPFQKRIEELEQKISSHLMFHPSSDPRC